MQVFAPAKINLSLHISAPIKSGAYKNYHNLDSLVVFANIGDIINISNSESLSLEIIGQFGADLKEFPIETNLIIRAANELQNYCGIKKTAHIILQKNLPIASGIGGGSADCAAAILGLNKFWQLNLSMDELVKIGEKMGADVAVCLRSKAAIMRGIGNEIIEAPNLPKNIPAIIANPLIECSTPFIYKKYDEIGKFNSDINFDYFNGDFRQILLNSKNNLENIAINCFFQIGQLIENIKALKGVEFVRMSGSGASVFAIFENENYAKLGAKILHDEYIKNGQKIWARDCFLNFENKINE